MSYKDKASTGEYRGGRVDPDAPSDDKPRRLRYPCFAAGCPMPGTIWVGIVQGGTTDRAGSCAWHHAVQPTDIPKVTQVLRDWMCVSAEFLAARRALSGDIASDPAALQREFDAAWQRLQASAGEWEQELRPDTIHTSKRVDTGYRQSYADWAKHLERFLGARVVEVLSTHRRSDDMPQARQRAIEVAAPAVHIPDDEGAPW